MSGKYEIVFGELIYKGRGRELEVPPITASRKEIGEGENVIEIQLSDNNSKVLEHLDEYKGNTH